MLRLTHLDVVYGRLRRRLLKAVCDDRLLLVILLVALLDEVAQLLVLLKEVLHQLLDMVFIVFLRALVIVE